MLVLKNILRKDSYIEADYYPEAQGKKYKVTVNLETGEVDDHGSRASGYLIHAKNKLLRLAKLETLPKEATEIWY